MLLKFKKITLFQDYLCGKQIFTTNLVLNIYLLFYTHVQYVRIVIAELGPRFERCTSVDMLALLQCEFQPVFWFMLCCV